MPTSPARREPTATRVALLPLPAKTPEYHTARTFTEERCPCTQAAGQLRQCGLDRVGGGRNSARAVSDACDSIRQHLNPFFAGVVTCPIPIQGKRSDSPFRKIASILDTPTCPMRADPDLELTSDGAAAPSRLQRRSIRVRREQPKLAAISPQQCFSAVVLLGRTHHHAEGVSQLW